MRVTVLAFASVGEALGWKHRDVELPAGADVEALLAALLAEAPALGGHLDHLGTAVDGELAPRATVLADGAEVALLPPVSGG